MNQAPPNRVLSDRVPEEKTLLERIQRELWPAAQIALRMLGLSTQTSTLEVTGSQALTGEEEFVKADATAGNITLTLPSAATWMRFLTVMKTDATANTVTVQAVVTGNPVLAAQWDKASFVTDGVSFYEV